LAVAAYGPKSEESDEENEGGIPMVIWISIGCIGGVTMIAVIVVVIIVCRRRNANDRGNRK
jgi:hypothetical protein